MKKWFLVVLLALLVGVVPCQSAVTVTAATGTVTAYDAIPNELDNAGVNILKIAVASDASGDFSATIDGMRGYITACYFIAGDSLGASTPTDNYDFDLIADYSNISTTAVADGPNLLGTIADDLDSPAADGSGTTVLKIPIFSDVRLVGDNMGATKKVTVIFMFEGG